MEIKGFKAYCKGGEDRRKHRLAIEYINNPMNGMPIARRVLANATVLLVLSCSFGFGGFFAGASFSIFGWNLGSGSL